MDFFSLLSQHIYHNNITLNITLMFSFPQHPQPLREPGPEDEVHVAGVDRLEQGQDEGRHQVRVQEAAPEEGVCSVSKAVTVHVTGQEKAYTCTCSYTCTCTCTT